LQIGAIARSPRETIEVSVLVNGIAQPLYRRFNDNALFVVGVPGQVYTLGVRNTGGDRIEILNTVDGRNTLKDEPGDVDRNRGLVFRPWASGEFSGWRVSDDETRQFIFGLPERSVAAQATGSTSNVGVIGFAAYKERASYYAQVYSAGTTYSAGAMPPPNVGRTSYSTLNSVGTSSMSASAPLTTAENVATFDFARGLGTGIGERQQDHVGKTTFTRSGDPDVLVIGYDTCENLQQMGVILQSGPSAFPGMPAGYEQYRSAA
jgi:hypothetical protein